MANSLSHVANRVFSGESSHLTQDSAGGSASTPAVSASAPAPTSSGGDPSASAVAPVVPEQSVKRKRGRPKGSTSKKTEPVEGGIASASASGGSGAKPKRPVGRPRKDGLPAGSVPKRSSAKKPRLASEEGAQYHGFPQWGGPPMPPHGAHPIVCLPQDSKFVLDEWGELARTNPRDLLNALLGTFSAPNPTSAVGPTVEEAFKIHLQSLAPNPAAPSAHNIPSLYSILKTFWLPSSPAYFTMAASASNTRMPMEYRFLYWDPQPLVFNGIQCLFCPNFLTNNGRIMSGPLKIYDLDKPFFIIGCEYACTSPQCIAASGSPEGRKFGSTDASIMNSLPKGLKDEFPARLLYVDSDAGSGPSIWNWNAMGVSTSLWNLVLGGLSMGLRKEAIVHLVRSMQYGPPPEFKFEVKEERSSTAPAREAVEAQEGPGDAAPDSTRPAAQNGWNNVDEGRGPAASQPQQAQAPNTPSQLSSPQTQHHSPPHPQHPQISTFRARPQPPSQQARQSPVFTQYTYSQYAYYPDQPGSAGASAAPPAGAGAPNTTPQRAGAARSSAASGNQMNR